MSGCGGLCVLIIWAGLLFPVLTSGCCLISKRREITNKVKYFFISAAAGYMWVAIFSVARNLILNNKTTEDRWHDLLVEHTNTFMAIDLAMHLVPVLAISYFLSQNRILNFGKTK